MWRRVLGWLAGAMVASSGVAWAGGAGGTGGWVVNGVTQGQGGGGGGSSGPIVAQSVIYVNGDYPNVQAAMDALFDAMPTNSVVTNATVARAYGQYVIAGLHDNTGKGAVTMSCFNQKAQLWYASRGLPEAGVNPVTRLLDGEVKEHYHASRLAVSGLSSLGWAQYDVFFYGFNGTARCWIGIDEVTPQTASGFDPLNVAHRTQFVAGVNYVKFAGLNGDSFRMEFPCEEFSGIQIVKTGSAGQPEGIGVRWTGGGPLLASTNAVGAEVASDHWYNIDEEGVIYH